jgi:asparagine synthetase B (glutamine-hydrolysing)
MCGFVAVVGEQIPAAVAAAAVARLEHRGPDAAGVRASQDPGVCCLLRSTLGGSSSSTRRPIRRCSCGRSPVGGQSAWTG